MTLADAAESWLAAHYEDMIAWRRHIHRHPELGRQEYATTQFVAERLADAGLNPKVLPGGTGLTCDFGPEHQPRIALRADMDALPMAELTGAPYASTVPNIAHACGHDAHTAILLGTALTLASVPELPVGVRLIFQAAEELMPCLLYTSRWSRGPSTCPPCRHPTSAASGLPRASRSAGPAGPRRRPRSAGGRPRERAAVAAVRRRR